jgi:hypothetical protein
MGPIIKAHFDQRKYADWLKFAQELPSPRARCRVSVHGTTADAG